MKTKKITWPSGIKKTKSRQIVLDILSEQTKPLSAIEIYDLATQANKDESIWLSTIYRVLDSFVKSGIIIKNTILDNEVAVYEINKYKHKHYAICLSCKNMMHMENCPMELFIPKVSENNFQVVDHKIEIYGYCNTCSQKK